MLDTSDNSALSLLNVAAITKQAPATDGILYLTRVADDFDSTRDVALGPWCFIGREDVDPSWDERPMLRSFANGDELAAASLQARRLTDYLIITVGAQLNARHGMTLSPVFWRYLLAAWISNLVQVSWARFVYVEKFILEAGHRRLHVTVDTSGPAWDFLTTSAFVDCATVDAAFHNWLNSKIVTKLAPSAWTISAGPAGSIPQTATDDTLGVVAPPRLKYALHKVIGRLLFDRVAGAGLWRFPFSLYLRLLPRRTALKAVPTDRNYNPAEEFPREYLDLVDQLVAETLPRSFGDDFLSYYVPAQSNRFVAGRLCVTSHSYEEKQKFVDACAKEAGEQLICSQHGGAYGTARSAGMVYITEYEHAAFFTWGWTAQQDCKGRFVPVPSPYLARYANRHQDKTGKLILVSPAARVQLQRLDAAPQPDQIVACRRDRVTFFNNLKPEILSRAMYRPYLRDHELLEDTAYVQRKVPSIQVLSGELHREILRCRLVVLDHLSTTFSIAMVANVPTIGCWDPTAWPLADEARPFFAQLEEVGIIVRSPQQAAELVNTIWSDVGDWWDQPHRQDARRKWCEQYARTRRAWWLHWAKALYYVAKSHSA